jgi:hypothetical protein
VLFAMAEASGYKMCGRKLKVEAQISDTITDDEGIWEDLKE